MKITDMALAKRKASHPSRGWITGVVSGVLMGAVCLPIARADDAPAKTTSSSTTSTTQTTTVTSAPLTINVGTGGVTVNGVTISGGTVANILTTPSGTQIVLSDGTKILVAGTTTTIAGPTIQTIPAAPEIKPEAKEIKPEVKLTLSQTALKQAKRSIREVSYGAAEQQSRQSLATAKTAQERGNALMVLGQTFYSRRQYDLARAQWNRAAVLKAPELATRAHASIARSYVAQENLDAAIAQYKIALSSVAADSVLSAEDRGDNKILVALPLAAIYFKRGQLETARQQFRQIAQSAPNEPQVSALGLLLVGAIEILQKNPQAASTSFDQAAKQLASRAKSEADFQSTLQKLNAALASVADKNKLSNLSGPEIGNKLLEVLVSSFGDGFDSLFDANDESLAATDA